MSPFLFIVLHFYYTLLSLRGDEELWKKGLSLFDKDSPFDVFDTIKNFIHSHKFAASFFL